MNKRQKKKFDKKLGCRSYYNYRYKKILNNVSKHMESGDWLYIVDSKRMDLKHISKINVLKNVHPMLSPSLQQTQSEFELSFSCNPLPLNSECNMISNHIMQELTNIFINGTE